MHGPWNWVSLYWLLWLVIGFGAPEFYFLATGQSHNTLSDQVWHLTGIGGHRPWSFMRFMVACFMIWLTLHFTEGWFR